MHQRQQQACAHECDQKLGRLGRKVAHGWKIGCEQAECQQLHNEVCKAVPDAASPEQDRDYDKRGYMQIAIFLHGAVIMKMKSLVKDIAQNPALKAKNAGNLIIDPSSKSALDTKKPGHLSDRA